MSVWLIYLIVAGLQLNRNLDHFCTLPGEFIQPNSLASTHAVSLPDEK
jgi:hypothetical protein